MTEVPSIAFHAGDHRGNQDGFVGAKVAVFVGDRIVSLLRDDNPNVPHPGKWDLPGGGRDGVESAWRCAARECCEEVGLRLAREDVLWGRRYQSGSAHTWFFVAWVGAQREKDLVLGDEGQAIELMSVDEYLSHPMAIERFQMRLADWVAGVACSA